MYQMAEPESSATPTENGFFISDWMVHSMIIALSVIALWTVCICVLTAYIVRVYCRKRKDKKGKSTRIHRHSTDSPATLNSEHATHIQVDVISDASDESVSEEIKLILPTDKRLSQLSVAQMQEKAQEIQDQIQRLHLDKCKTSISSTLNTAQLVHAVIHVADDDLKQPYDDDLDQIEEMINPENIKKAMQDDRAPAAYHMNTQKLSELTPSPEPSPIPRGMALDRQHTIISDRNGHYPTIPASSVGPRHIPGSPMSVISDMYDNPDIPKKEMTPDGFKSTKCVVDRQQALPNFMTNALPRFASSSAGSGYRKIYRKQT